MKNIILTLVIITKSIFVFAQTEEVKPLVNWLSIEEALEKNKTQPKKILIDAYTNWCGWCKVMDKNTFSNPNIAAYINQNFYAVKFNAETFDTITYKEKKYVNNGTGNRPPHELAIEILKGQMSYPTIVYMDEKSDLITAVPGYMTPDQIEPVLIFFSQDIYKQLPFDKFKEYFELTFKDSVKREDPIKWRTLEEVSTLMTKAPRKVLIDFYADYSPLSKIMHKATYSNPAISKYINDNYYAVKVDALTKDTLDYFGQKYINEGKEHPFNQFAVTLLQGKMSFPSVVYISESNQLISAVPGYMSPMVIEPILEFFSKDIYKSESYDEFRKTFKSQIAQ